MLPSISIIIVARNAIRVLPECLARIGRQSYDKALIEVLLIDGGSTDGTRECAARSGVQVVDGGHPENQEARRYLGARTASREILAYIDADNFLPDENWLVRMVSPFADPNVVCSFTKWYGLDPSLSAIDKYYALLGGNDPVAYYLGKHDRVPYGNEELPWGAELISKSDVAEFVRFSPNRLPTLGCNGFLVRSSYFGQLEFSTPDMFYHTDVHVDLLKRNPNVKYAIVPTVIVHSTGGTLGANLKKRLRYKCVHMDQLARYRRYRVFDSGSWNDRARLAFAIIAGLTMIEPTMRATIGFLRTHRAEWFMHPIATFSMVCVYGYSVLLNLGNKLTKSEWRKRQ
ncbi:MAG: glycosyltransferase [Burkholderiales bacterium]